MRLIRGWNQTGQKFAGEPDIVKTYIIPHPMLLWTLVAGAYLMVSGQLVQGLRGLPIAISSSLVAALTSAAFTFKLAFTNEDAPELVAGIAKTLVDLLPEASLVIRARLVFAGLALSTTYVLYLVFWRRSSVVHIPGNSAFPLLPSCPQLHDFFASIYNQRLTVFTPAANTLHTLYTMLAMTQSRATNIPLFLLFSLQNRFLSSLDLSLVEISTSSLLLSFASFFAFGGSNAISSVDLSSAYNGVAGFNVVVVGVLTFVSNWAAPIYWVFAANVLLLRKQRSDGGRENNVFLQHVALLAVFTTFSVTSVMAACTALRTHLFIWTVFSPKYLYCMAWALGQHLVVHIGLGGLLFWLG